MRRRPNHLRRSVDGLTPQWDLARDIAAGTQRRAERRRAFTPAMYACLYGFFPLNDGRSPCCARVESGGESRSRAHHNQHSGDCGRGGDGSDGRFGEGESYAGAWRACMLMTSLP